MIEMSLMAAILDQRRAACKTFSMNRRLSLVVSWSSIGMLCAGVSAFPAESAGMAASADLVAHCKSVGTSDLVRPAPDAAGSFWRCMDGLVFVCAVGANIPCQSKADVSRRNSGAEAFCRENPDAQIVPAYAAGHRTIYAWRCVAATAVRGRVVLRLDRRGFQADFWHQLAPARTG
jgi:hypothetical protein